MDNKKHITILSLLLIVLGSIQFLLGFGFIKGFSFIGTMIGDSTVETILGSVGSFIGTMFLFMSFPSIIAGIGLLNYKSWSRILGLIVCIVKLFSIPFGTIIGVYGIWVLMQDETIKLLKQ